MLSAHLDDLKNFVPKGSLIIREHMKGRTGPYSYAVLGITEYFCLLQKQGLTFNHNRFIRAVFLALLAKQFPILLLTLAFNQTLMSAGEKSVSLLFQREGYVLLYVVGANTDTLSCTPSEIIQERISPIMYIYIPVK